MLNGITRANYCDWRMKVQPISLLILLESIVFCTYLYLQTFVSHDCKLQLDPNYGLRATTLLLVELFL
jgi:hypothetical protein